MTTPLQIVNETGEEIVEDIFQTALQVAIAVLDDDFPPALSLVLVTDERMTDLNRRYRRVPETTDVLSFAYPEEGEIFISPTVARAQSVKLGYSFSLELQFLFIHGLLHILGYSHDDPAAERVMMDLSEQIITRLV